MKVAFFTHYGSYSHGSNRSLVNLIDGLRPHGVQALVVHPPDSVSSPLSLKPVLKARGVPTVAADVAWWVAAMPSRRGAFRRFLRNVRSLPQVCRQLRTWGCDVLYTNSSVIPFGAMSAVCMNRPHIWHIREFSDLDFSLRPDWGQPVFRRVIARSAATVAVSHAVRSHVLRGRQARRCSVVYNGVAFRREFDRLHEVYGDPTKARHHGFTFSILGTVRPSKGQAEAIRALACACRTHPGVRLLVAGDGRRGYTEECKDLAARLGIAERVVFLGYVDDPYSVYMESDAIVVCSRNEGMGRVTVEAMSACRPVIGFDNAGTAELIVHGFNGLLYRDGDGRLADCMRKLADDPAGARQMGLNGWRAGREKYCIEMYAEKIYGVLSAVVEAS